MCFFTLKQSVSEYNNKGSLVFCAFLDASKAFDRVNHSSLFCKLIEKVINLSSVRLLHFWYSNQSMVVEWKTAFYNILGLQMV